MDEIDEIARLQKMVQQWKNDYYRMNDMHEAAMRTIATLESEKRIASVVIESMVSHIEHLNGAKK